jgi:hypothetical protein
MKFLTAHTVRRCLAVFGLIVAPTLMGNWMIATTAVEGSQAVVLSARIEGGSLTYRLNGKKVEDSKDNSLLVNLARVARLRGTDVPVFIVIDVRAPFAEAGKLETALEKAGLVHHRLFVSNFTSGIMNEIHWDETAVPIPSK